MPFNVKILTPLSLSCFFSYGIIVSRIPIKLRYVYKHYAQKSWGFFNEKVEVYGFKIPE